jgi:hypothetical protein
MTAPTASLIAERDALVAQLEEAEQIADDRKRRHAIEAKKGALELAAADAEVAILNAQDAAQSEYETATREYIQECERAEKQAEKLVGCMNACRARRAQLDGLRVLARGLELELPKVQMFAPAHLSDLETRDAWKKFVDRWRASILKGWDW